MITYWLEDGTGTDYKMQHEDQDEVIAFAVTSQRFFNPSDRVVAVRTIDNHLVWARPDEGKGS